MYSSDTKLSIFYYEGHEVARNCSGGCKTLEIDTIKNGSDNALA